MGYNQDTQKKNSKIRLGKRVKGSSPLVDETRMMAYSKEWFGWVNPKTSGRLCGAVRPQSICRLKLLLRSANL